MSSPASSSLPNGKLAADSQPPISTRSWVDLVTEKVSTLHYGVVQIVIHDSKVVQVESTERHRFDLRRSQ